MLHYQTFNSQSLCPHFADEVIVLTRKQTLTANETVKYFGTKIKKNTIRVYLQRICLKSCLSAWETCEVRWIKISAINGFVAFSILWPLLNKLKQNMFYDSKSITASGFVMKWKLVTLLWKVKFLLYYSLFAIYNYIYTLYTLVTFPFCNLNFR